MNHATFSGISSLLEKPMTRRSVLRTLGLSGASMVALSTMRVAADSSADRHTSQLYTVTAASNFRAGPGTNHPVIAVIPKGATFTLTAQEQNNFYGVNYHGAGWVYAPLIVPAGTSESPDPVIVGEARTSTAVNLRSGPSTGHMVLRVVPAGAAVQVSNTVQNGFRYVVHEGLAGWMFDEYLVWGTHQPPGETFTTTAALNLRAEPSTSAKILLVMPEGARVDALDAWANGFRKVSYKGTVGWAYTAYLN